MPFTHAIEAYVSRKPNRSRDALALQRACGLIGPEPAAGLPHPANQGGREAMMLGATQARHGVLQRLGRPGPRHEPADRRHFQVPHGLSNAVLLPEVTAFSAPAAIDRYAACARAMKIAGPDPSSRSAVSALVAELEALNDDLDVPGTQMRDRPGPLGGAAPDHGGPALASGSPSNNPVEPSADEIVALFNGYVYAFSSCWLQRLAVSGDLFSNGASSLYRTSVGLASRSLSVAMTAC